MPANTVRRIHKPTATHVPPDVVLRFTDGLEVHPADCPRGIQAHPHWQPGPDGRAVCKCTVIAAECEGCGRDNLAGRLCQACRRAEDGPYDERCDDLDLHQAHALADLEDARMEATR